MVVWFLCYVMMMMVEGDTELNMNVHSEEWMDEGVNANLCGRVG